MQERSIGSVGGSPYEGPVSIQCSGCQHSVDFMTEQERDRFLNPIESLRYPGWRVEGIVELVCPVCQKVKK